MVKLHLVRGPIVAAIALMIVVIGANLFDNSYQTVEQILRIKSTLIEDRQILANQFTNSSIPSDKLKEHNVLIIHATPTSGSVKLEGIEPNGMTFEKESKDGFLYHIIEKNMQGGSYSIKISNIGNQPVKINVIIGEDPFLSKNCSVDGMQCSMVWVAIGLVVIGIIAFIVGILIVMLAFKNERKKK